MSHQYDERPSATMIAIILAVLVLAGIAFVLFAYAHPGLGGDAATPAG